MKAKDILNLRLQNQLLSSRPLKSVAEVVRWLGAVQAQDYLGSLWAIGLRIKKVTENDVEKAIEDRTIVRSWPMRGTIHYTAPENIRWMLKLLAPRIIKKATPIYRSYGVDDKVLIKSATVVEKALHHNPILTRDEIYEELEKAKIKTDDTRGLHILGWMAQMGIICQANRKGKQFTFTLLDSWIPKTADLTRDEAFDKLATMYFQSHGPATVRDFAWWTGFNLTEAKQAIEIAKDKLVALTLDNESYWYTGELKSKTPPREVYLLPSYDEYAVGYKDRSHFLSDKYKSAARNGIFSPVILVDGQIAGTWKRTLAKDGVSVSTEKFYKFSQAQVKQLETAVTRYEKFLDV